jgi:serine/threonine protein kinase
VSRCYGISRNPETNEYMMIMDCARNGGLRQYLDENFSSLRWDQKFNILSSIALGLSNIHKRGLIHRDFHIGNMIVDFNQLTYVTDLGLCRPMNVQNNDVYGVLPYVAPEILRGKECTQKSDIYGFGIIAYETCTGLPPYHDIAHDRTLAIQICQGLRPKSNYSIPQLIQDIIYQCWDDDPLKRPDAEELCSLFNEYEREIVYLDYDSAQLPMNNPALPPPPPYVRVVTEICTQTKEVDEINKDLPAISSNTTLQSNSNALSYSTHPQAVYKSKLLDFADLPESNLIDLNID